MNEENVKKESEIELIKHQLSNIYYKRAFDEDFNRGIRVIEVTRKDNFIMIVSKIFKNAKNKLQSFTDDITN